MVGTYSLTSGITALIKQLSHWGPRGERIMGKQYPRLEISLLCKSAASLGRRCVMMRRTELGFSWGWGRGTNPTWSIRGRTTAAAGFEINLLKSLASASEASEWFLLCNTPGRGGVKPGLRSPHGGLLSFSPV